ncbi:8829_t:CDS:2 [Rhizophagus irregularis]|nr:8829_t:CDS:2 [Rhizophagus irregularis]
MSSLLEEIFHRNELQETDWLRTYKFLKKGMFGKPRGNVAIIFEDHVRNEYHVEVVEYWNHIWTCDDCDDNDCNEEVVLLKTLMEIEEEY